MKELTQDPYAQHQLKLQRYSGRGRESLAINYDVADRFMAVANIRRDIFIERWIKPQDDKNKKGFHKVERRDGEWVVKIDDEMLGQRATLKATNNIDIRRTFVTSFKHQVVKGIQECLTREKLKNGDRFGRQAAIAYAETLVFDGVIPASLLALANVSGFDPGFTLLMAGLSYMEASFANAVCNVKTILQAEKVYRKSLDEIENIPLSMPLPTDSIVKNQSRDLFSSPVPIDRYVMGTIFLAKNKDKLFIS